MIKDKGTICDVARQRYDKGTTCEQSLRYNVKGYIVMKCCRAVGCNKLHAATNGRSLALCCTTCVLPSKAKYFKSAYPDKTSFQTQRVLDLFLERFWKRQKLLILISTQGLRRFDNSLAHFDLVFRQGRVREKCAQLRHTHARLQLEHSRTCIGQQMILFQCVLRVLVFVTLELLNDNRIWPFKYRRNTDITN